MTKRAAPDVIDLTESPPEAGPSAATPQTPYDRAVAKCKESGARLAPAQLSMLQRLPEESLHLIACGLATLSEVEAAAAQDLADSWEPTPEEEREEMEGLNAPPAPAARLAGLPLLGLAPLVVPLLRSGLVLGAAPRRLAARRAACPGDAAG